MLLGFGNGMPTLRRQIRMIGFYPFQIEVLQGSDCSESVVNMLCYSTLNQLEWLYVREVLHLIINLDLTVFDRLQISTSNVLLIQVLLF